MNKTPPSAWTIGQKVICIDDKFPPAIFDWCEHLPIAGYIYTIRAMQAGYNHEKGLRTLGFLLAEIVNPLSSMGTEAGFDNTRFVPWLDVCSETGHSDAVEPVQHPMEVVEV